MGDLLRIGEMDAANLTWHSPGEVLLRQLLLAAVEKGAETFDFGSGDEPYKYRFATGATALRIWGLYPTARTTLPADNAEVSE